MIGFAAPGWLLGLLLVPLVWYLHRSGPSLRRVPVASLELWRDSAATAAHAGRVRRPDPAWRRRAAIAGLLSLALAGPQWPQAPRVTVWLDDSLSMRTRDASGTRLARGIAAAQAAVREASARDVVVRPLSDPARSYPRLDGARVESLNGAANTREPRLPPPEALRSDRIHWLVTDGADAAVNAWASAAPIARVLQATGPARNVGIARMSARAQPADGGIVVVGLQVVNGGDSRESRTVELTAGTTRIDSRPIELDPGESVTLEFSTVAGAFTARLTPADALPDDDVLGLEESAVAPLPVMLVGACPASIARAVRAHPALEVTGQRPARLVFSCGDPDTPVDVPSVRFVPGPPVALDAAGMAWSNDAEPLRVRLAGHLPGRASGPLTTARATDRVLLASGNAPLIVVREGTPRIVETTLDVTAPGYESGAGLPLLVGALADAALDTQLLTRIASAGLGEQASRVRPQPGPIVAAGSVAPAVTTDLPITPLLLLAFALLAWDTLLAARRLIHEYSSAAGRAT